MEIIIRVNDDGSALIDCPEHGVKDHYLLGVSIFEVAPGFTLEHIDEIDGDVQGMILLRNHARVPLCAVDASRPKTHVITVSEKEGYVEVRTPLS